MRLCFASLIVVAVSLHASAVSTTNSNGSVMTPNSELTRNQLVATDVSGLLSSESDPNVVFTNGELLVHGERVKIGPDETEVQEIANAAVETNALTVATTNRVALLESSKADKSNLDAHVANTSNPHSVTAGQVGAVPLIDDADSEKTAVTIGIRKNGPSVGKFSLANGLDVIANGVFSHAEGDGTRSDGLSSHAEGNGTTAEGSWSHAEGSETLASGLHSHAEGSRTTASGSGSHAEGCETFATADYSHAEGVGTTASGVGSHAEGSYTVASGSWSHAEGDHTSAVADFSHAEGSGTVTSGIGSHADGLFARTLSGHDGAFAWSGEETADGYYNSHGPGTYNINPKGGLGGFYIGEQTIYAILTNKADKADVIDPASATTAGKAADALKVKEALAGKLDAAEGDVTFNWNYRDSCLALISGYYGTGIGLDLYSGGGRIVNYTGHDIDPFLIELPDRGGTFALTSDIPAPYVPDHTDPTFSNAVLAVGLSVDTNSVAVLNEIASTFGGFPIEGTATTVGGLLAALAAAVAWLKKNKVGSFASVGGASATVDNGVAKLDDFFTKSNSLLNARITYERNATGLKDRAFNTLSFDGTEFNLSAALEAVTPTASGQPRDLLIVATATAATTIGYTAGTIKGDKPTIDGSGTWLITLTEYASGVWYCRQIKMEDAA